MSFSEFYTRPGGSNLNAGSTDSDSPVLALTGCDWVQSTRVLTKTGAITGVSVDDVASVFPDGASGATPYVARVTNVTSDTITLSSTALAGTAPTDGTANRSVNVGGAWGGSSSGDISHSISFPSSSLADSSGHPVRVNIKSGTWAYTSGISRGGGGVVYFSGYTTTPGDGGRAIIDNGTAANIGVSVTASGFVFTDCDFLSSATSGTSNLVTVNSAIRAVFLRCRFQGARGFGLTGTGVTATGCEAIDCNKSNSASTGGFSVAFAVDCISHDSSGSNAYGFVATSASMFERCIADRCGAAGFLLSSGYVFLDRCDVYNCANGAEFGSATLPLHVARDCNFIANSGYGISGSPSNTVSISSNNGFYSNTSGNYSTNVALLAFEPVAAVTLGSNPFAGVSTGARPTSGDFTVGTGLGRGAGNGSFLQSSSYYSSTTTSYPDRGAVQHQDSGVGTIVIGGEF